jgi:glycosyltransferase involved in cell wall biosynthesis
LVVDHDFPELGRDAGSKAIYHLVGLLQDRARVVFWSASSMPSVAGAALLRSQGVEVAAKEAGADLDQWLGQRERDGCSFDAMVLSRPIIAAIYMPLARRYIRGITAYYGHDIHHVRLADMKVFESVPGLEAEQREIGRIERRLWKAADVVFYPSDNEVDTVNEYRRRQRLGPNALVLPLWEAPDVPGREVLAGSRRGLLFVGSHAHAPNTDGLNWFFEQILPVIRRHGCDDIVYIVGSGMDRYRPPSDDPFVDVLGQIDDQALDALYAKVRVALVPLRYGGGVKGKVIEAMGKGVPCVTTSVGAQGLAWASEVLEPIDSPDAFANAVTRLTVSDALWKEKSSRGQSLLSAAYARTVISGRLYNALHLDAGCAGSPS